ncbi:SGNH/GDSL hydrolase family protein [Draconibacterium sp.]|nr:SGNH/GDSL hydrolase family protein [Draconibacterium sp.]
MNNSRRKFVKKVGLAGLAALGIPELLMADTSNETLKTPGKTGGLTILFQGDSITDGNRTRNNDWNHVMGHGYPYLISSRFWFDYPEKDFMFYNRGISGNRAKDLDDRWQTDTLDLKPDVISILVGINDVGATVHNRNPEPLKKFEEHYRSILDKTKKVLPGTQIILCEPFILPVGKVLENLEIYETEVKKQQKIIRKLAKNYNAVFVELQKPFTKACEKAPANYWIWDGIHPMPAGHELIAREWIIHAQNILT